MTLIIIAIAFLSGSIPFAIIIGKIVLRDDIRRYGDHNPGATNVFRAGGKHWGIIAGALDVAKGAVPVFIAYWILGITESEIIAIALAPILGHAFSPFLKFRGGKAVAVTFGIWIGLTLWEAPTVLGIMLGYWYASVKISGWAVLLAMWSLLIYLLLAHFNPILLAIWLGNMLILAYKHRHDLAQAPGVQYWLPFTHKAHVA